MLDSKNNKFPLWEVIPHLSLHNKAEYSGKNEVSQRVDN